MPSAPLPQDEAARLQELLEYEILDTDPEKDFDDIVKLASQICDTPLALISLVDKERQWFKAKEGNLKANETGRDVSFCAHAILDDGVFTVKDAEEDERFKENPFVTSKIMRFYAGIPLETEKGFKVGTLCVIDTVPRALDDSQLFALEVLGKQVMAQFELRKKVRDLAQHARELDFAYDAEKKARKEADDANRAKSRFLAHMSHEMRTPLHGILGMAEILTETTLSGDQEKLVTTLRSSGNTLLSIINDILDSSKITFGNLKITNQPLSLKMLIDSVALTFSTQINKKGLVFEVVQDPDCPAYVLCDALRVRQILYNLLGNAAKFTQSGEIRLALGATLLSDEEVLIRFSVSDTGPGIALEKQKLVFEEFQQSDPGISEVYGGTGLRISIARQLTELMGGKIGVNSPIYADPEAVGGPGTEFLLEIPLKIASGPFFSGEGSTDNNGAKLFNHVKALIAEDNPVNQIVICQFLKQLGIETIIANNGKEALDHYTQNRFQLVITDINMPEMDGVVLTKILRNTYKCRLPIIAMTANAFETDRKKYLEAGMDAVLSKPFDKTDLIELLKKMFTEEL